MKESHSLELYARLKRITAAGTLAGVTAAAALLAAWNPFWALGLFTGGVAGTGNALLSMYGNERLLDRRGVAIFVLSSFLRLCFFGIVPVALALWVSSVWVPVWYFIGFFTPLGLYGILLGRALREEEACKRT